MDVPAIYLPTVEKIDTISIPLPTGNIPTYVPLVVPPSDLREPEGTQPETTEEEPTGIRQVDIPFIDFKMPLPENEILITASTCLLYTSPSPRDMPRSRMPSSA